MIINGVLEFDDLNKEADEIQDPEEEIIKRYEDIIKTKKNYKRRILLRTRFKKI